MNKRNPAARLLKFGGFGRLVGLMIVVVPLMVVFVATLNVNGAAADGADMAQNETLVRCNPAMAAGLMGQPLAVELYVEDVVDLWAAHLKLDFDTSIAQVVDANPNADGVQIEILSDFLKPDFLLRQNADNVAGTIDYAVTQVNPTLPVSGSGALARITFQPLQTGTFTMPFTKVEIVQRTGAEIEATIIDCHITFFEGGDPDLTTYLPAAFAQN